MSLLRDLELSVWQELQAFQPEWCSSSPLYGMLSLCITCVRCSGGLGEHIGIQVYASRTLSELDKCPTLDL